MASAALPFSLVPPTSLRAKLFNIFVSPSDVFDEVLASPSNLANWRIPTLLVCLVNVIILQPSDSLPQFALTIRRLAETGTMSEAQAQALAGAWPLLSASLVCIATFIATFWSAFVLWFIGRVFLKVGFPYLKALEIVGLTGFISVLSSIVTMLLVAVTGNAAARPALSLLVSELDSSERLFQTLELLNFFHFWSATVLAIGLSRQSGVSFKEAAFWIFGYWVVTRLVLIVAQ